MNSRLLLLLPIFVLSQWISVSAEPPAPSATAPAAPVAKVAKTGGPNIFIEARVVSLPQNLALPLMRRFRSAKPAERAEALAALDELIGSGTAKLHAWPVLTTHSEERVVSEDVDEFRYATQFEAERLTVQLHEEDQVFSTEAREVRALESEPQATDFESRQLGITLEADPTLAKDGRSMDLNMALQHVRLKEIERITIERESLPEKKSAKVSVEQPRFSVMKAQSWFSIESGDAKLVGVFKSPEGENQLELFVIRAEIVGK